MEITAGVLAAAAFVGPAGAWNEVPGADMAGAGVAIGEPRPADGDLEVRMGAAGFRIGADGSAVPYGKVPSEAYGDAREIDGVTRPECAGRVGTDGVAPVAGMLLRDAERRPVLRCGADIWPILPWSPPNTKVVSSIGCRRGA